MTEVAWTRQFLGVLDSRPIVLQPDHVEDPRKYPARPAYILPKMPKPMTKPSKRAAPGQERSITVVLKSLRNPPLDLQLSSQALSTSVHDLKSTVSEKTGAQTDKVRLLLNKKPCPDSKTLKELVGDGETMVEFSVMIIGGVPATSTPARVEPQASAGEQVGSTALGVNGAEAVNTTEFWDDLKGFLTQRLKDDAEGQKLFNIFKNAWEAEKGR